MHRETSNEVISKNGLTLIPSLMFSEIEVLILGYLGSYNMQ